jgi:hypothetical protein
MVRKSWQIKIFVIKGKAGNYDLGGKEVRGVYARQLPIMETGDFH